MSGAPNRRHPWEVARAAFFRRVLAESGALDEPRDVLDVGAGDGYLARELLAVMPAGSQVVCLDPNYADEDLARFTSPPVPGLSFAREVPARRFDLVLMLDVIEHVPDDRAFLAGFVARSLSLGGQVLASVPAWQGLFSAHDVALKHYRRYSPGSWRKLIEEQGLVAVRGGGLFHALLVPRALTVAREQLWRLLGREPAAPDNLGAWRGGALVTRILGGALALDNALTLALGRRGLSIPGLSEWVLCRPRAGGAT